MRLGKALSVLGPRLPKGWAESQRGVRVGEQAGRQRQSQSETCRKME